MSRYLFRCVVQYAISKTTLQYLRFLIITLNSYFNLTNAFLNENIQGVNKDPGRLYFLRIDE